MKRGFVRQKLKPLKTFLVRSPHYERGAGGGNRTLVCSLEGYRSTIELRPQMTRRRMLAEPEGNCNSELQWVALRRAFLGDWLALRVGGEGPGVATDFEAIA